MVPRCADAGAWSAGPYKSGDAGASFIDVSVAVVVQIIGANLFHRKDGPHAFLRERVVLAAGDESKGTRPHAGAAGYVASGYARASFVKHPVAVVVFSVSAELIRCGREAG